MRESPASFAAAVKVGQESVTAVAGAIPGCTFDEPAATVAEPPKSSLPVNDLRMVAAAALKALCPEQYSGNGGVRNVSGWKGFQFSPNTVAGFSGVPPQVGIVWPVFKKRIAVIGRSES